MSDLLNINCMFTRTPYARGNHITMIVANKPSEANEINEGFKAETRNSRDGFQLIYSYARLLEHEAQII